MGAILQLAARRRALGHRAHTGGDGDFADDALERIQREVAGRRGGTSDEDFRAYGSAGGAAAGAGACAAVGAAAAAPACGYIGGKIGAEIGSLAKKGLDAIAASDAGASEIARQERAFAALDQIEADITSVLRQTLVLMAEESGKGVDAAARELRRQGVALTAVPPGTEGRFEGPGPFEDPNQWYPGTGGRYLGADIMGGSGVGGCGPIMIEKGGQWTLQPGNVKCAASRMVRWVEPLPAAAAGGVVQMQKIRLDSRVVTTPITKESTGGGGGALILVAAAAGGLLLLARSR